MTRTDPVPFMHLGMLASMSVVRNEDDCWGQCTVADVEYVIECALDLYDEPDHLATAAFIKVACKSGGTMERLAAAVMRAQRKLGEHAAIWFPPHQGRLTPPGLPAAHSGGGRDHSAARSLRGAGRWHCLRALQVAGGQH